MFFATGNTSKFDEYRALLGLPEMKWNSLKIPQDAGANITLVAAAKLEHAKKEIDKFPFFVEESGLSIPAWNDLPGAFSSIYINQLGSDLFWMRPSNSPSGSTTPWGQAATSRLLTNSDVSPST